MKKSTELAPMSIPECLTLVDKLERKLKGAHPVIKQLLQKKSLSDDASWRVVKNPTTNRTQYICTNCGKVSPVPVKHCVECGVCMVNEDGQVKKTY